MTKRERFEQALTTHYEVAVCVVDGPQVELPPTVWRKHPNFKRSLCVLRYGLDQAKPIPDLDVTDEGIRATLSFSQNSVKTFVPWSSVSGIEGDGERPKRRPQLTLV